MTAWQRTHILRREEKGIGPFSTKRLIIAGASGMLASLVLTRLLGFGLGCLSSGLCLAAVLVITHPVNGQILIQHTATIAHGILTLSVMRGSEGGISDAIASLGIDPEAGILLGEELFEYSSEDDDQELAYDVVLLGTSPDAVPTRYIEAPTFTSVQSTGVSDGR